MDDSAYERPRRAGLTRWRDWRLTTKLVAVIGVPLLFLFTLGGVQIQGAVAKTSEYARTQKLVAVTAALGDVVAGLQQERTAAATEIAAGTRGAGMEPYYRVTDSANKALSQRLSAAGPLPAGLRPTAISALSGLSSLRTSAEPAAQVVDGYSRLIGPLRLFDQELAAGLADPRLSAAALALFDLRAVQEEVAVQRAVLAGTSGTITAAQRDLVRASDARMAVRAADFLASASPADAALYQNAMGASAARSREQLKVEVLGAEPTVPAGWNGASDQTAMALNGLAITLTPAAASPSRAATRKRQQRGRARVGDPLRGVADSGQRDDRDRSPAGPLAGRVAPAGRRCGRPPVAGRGGRPAGRPPGGHHGRVGRRAGRDRPARRRFRRGARAGVAAGGRADPAAGQLRGDLRQLSRRSETLVQRQLALIEQLEQDEDDPDQLSILFQLDHLATRMRRNNENLMVLSGTDVTRQFTRPVGLQDVLRAAVSEIEHYQRGWWSGRRPRWPSPAMRSVMSYAWSPSCWTTPPRSPRRAPRSPSAAIRPALAGCRWTSSTTALACRRNRSRLPTRSCRRPPRWSRSTSRRMGLFVVGRLARRHGVRVLLHSGEELGGVRATITLPAALLQPESEAQHAGPADEWRPSPRQKVLNGGHRADLLASLPKRRPRRLAKAPRTVPPPVGPEQVSPAPVNGSAISAISPAIAAAAAAVEEVAGLAPEWATNAEHTGEILIAPRRRPPTRSPGRRRAPRSSTRCRPAGSPKKTRKLRRRPPSRGPTAADADIAAVTRALAGKPTKVTAAGLPKRVPRAMLVPGTASSPAPAAVVPAEPPAKVAPIARQSAERVRDQFASYQRGVRQARSVGAAGSTDTTVDGAGRESG
nr:nitrate- and nitrite sensing domain-containing protein [Fodinicola feengrottensis]